MRSVFFAAVGLFVCTGTVLAELVWYGSVGSSDPSGTAENQIVVGVRDATMNSVDTIARSEYTYIQAVQANAFPPFQEADWVMSLDDLFGTHIMDSTEVNSAHLWFRAHQSSGGPRQWNVQGIAAADADWEHSASGATWAEKSAGTSWSGGTLGQSRIGNYGTVMLGGETQGEWYSIDLTSAFKDYADGLIGGIVIAPASSNDGGGIYFGMDSSESAVGIGFVVDQVPSAVSGYDSWIDDFSVSGSPDADRDYDYDGDGQDNLMEYALGGDPTNALVKGGYSSEIMDDAGTNYFVYVHPQRSDDAQLNYYLQLDDNLIDAPGWTNVGYVVTGTNVTGGVLDYVTNHVPVNEYATRFIRLMIESN
jgi:hypothetical protein